MISERDDEIATWRFLVGLTAGDLLALHLFGDHHILGVLVAIGIDPGDRRRPPSVLEAQLLLFDMIISGAERDALLEEWRRHRTMLPRETLDGRPHYFLELDGRTFFETWPQRVGRGAGSDRDRKIAEAAERNGYKETFARPWSGELAEPDESVKLFKVAPMPDRVAESLDQLVLTLPAGSRIWWERVEGDLLSFLLDERPGLAPRDGEPETMLYALLAHPPGDGDAEWLTSLIFRLLDDDPEAMVELSRTGRGGVAAIVAALGQPLEPDQAGALLHVLGDMGLPEGIDAVAGYLRAHSSTPGDPYRQVALRELCHAVAMWGALLPQHAELEAFIRAIDDPALNEDRDHALAAIDPADDEDTPRFQRGQQP